MKKQTYLDYNATAPLRPGVKDAVLEAMSEPGNASSIHMQGRLARKRIETARAQIAEIAGGRAEKVVFNSGATEGNNTVIKGFPSDKVLVSAVEHPCVHDLVPEKQRIRVSADGVIDLNHLEDKIREERPALVSVMMVNNETGVVQPVKEVVKLCHDHGVKVHTDATQAVGRIPVNLFLLNADYMTISSHKLGGPQGVGALIITNDTEAPVWLEGGGQEKRARAGTENVAGIAGFGAAAAHAKEHLDTFQSHTTELQNYLESEIKNLSQDIVIYGENEKRVSNTTCLSLPGATAETMIIAFDLEGICISSGSACSSGKVSESHVLKAMGADEARLKGALRISTGWATTREEVDLFLKKFEIITKRAIR